MTQKKTIIETDKQRLRGYELYGVITPASVTDEYVKLTFSNLFLTKSFNVSLHFPIELKEVRFSNNDTFATTETATLFVNGYPVAEKDVGDKTKAIFYVSNLVLDGDEIELNSSGSNINTSEIVVIGKRVAVRANYHTS